jgi:putative protein-disulfide isomerase
MDKGKSAGLLYITNPMCSWSYGFLQEINRLKEEYQDVLDFRLLMGAIRISDTQALDEPSKDALAHQWHQVHERTGQEFNFGLFNQDQFIFNTEAACRAMVLARHLIPEKEFEVFEALQKAFFQDLVNITQADGLLQVLLPFQISEETFLSLFHSNHLKEEVQQHFDYANKIGATVLPSVYLESGRQVLKIGRGYRTFEDMQPVVDQAIHQIRTRLD